MVGVDGRFVEADSGFVAADSDLTGNGNGRLVDGWNWRWFIDRKIWGMELYIR